MENVNETLDEKLVNHYITLPKNYYPINKKLSRIDGNPYYLTISGSKQDLALITKVYKGYVYAKTVASKKVPIEQLVTFEILN